MQQTHKTTQYQTTHNPNNTLQTHTIQKKKHAIRTRQD